MSYPSRGHRPTRRGAFRPRGRHRCERGWFAGDPARARSYSAVDRQGLAGLRATAAAGPITGDPRPPGPRVDLPVGRCRSSGACTAAMLGPAHDPRRRPSDQAVRVRRRPRRPGLRGRSRAGVRLPRAPTDPARRRRCGSCWASSSPMPAGSPGAAPRATGCPVRPGAICPRSAASIRGCACSTSWCSSPGSTGCRRSARSARRWPGSGRFRAEDLAERKAEQLSKGNQQKVQFIAAVPARSAGAADGRAVHRSRSGQHDAPARGIPRAAGPGPDGRVLDPPDGGGRGAVRVGGDHRPRSHGGRRTDARRSALDRPADGADRGRRRTIGCRGWRPCRARAIIQAGMDRSTVELDDGRRAGRGAGGGGRRRGAGRHFEVADPTLEQVFIDLVGRPVGRGDAPRRRPRPRHGGQVAAQSPPGTRHDSAMRAHRRPRGHGGRQRLV